MALPTCDCIGELSQADKLSNIYCALYTIAQGGGGGLPDQTGHAGQFLRTDGTTASWSSALSIAAGKTFTVSNTLTLAGTDGTTITFPPASASIGYLGIPQNSQSAAYTTVLADSGKQIFHPTADNNARTFTIDSNANVPYPVGTAITFVNQINTVTIAISADTLVLAGAGTTGSRTLAANGIATALKITSTTWLISGTGLT